MTTVGSSTSLTAVFRALSAFYDDAEQDIREIADEIDDVVNFKKTIHDALDKLRNGDVQGLFNMLDQPGMEDLSAKITRPSPEENVPGTGREEVAFDLPIIGHVVLVEGREPDKRYSKDQIEALKDRFKDIGDEASQIATKLQLRFQMKNQAKSETFGALSNSLKSEHDSAMTAVNNSKA